MPGRVAGVETDRADLGQVAVGVHVLGPGVAVAEVGGEVEGQRGGQPRGLRDRLGMVLEARGHRLRRREHVGVVAAPQRLGGVQRRVLADRHERVLQPRAGRARARGRRRSPRTAPRAARPARASPRFSARSWRANGRCSSIRNASRPEGGQQRPRRRLVAHARARAARQADQPLGMLGEIARASATAASSCAGPGVSRVCACARVSSRQRLRQPAASRDQQGQVRWRVASSVAGSTTSTSAPWMARSPSDARRLRELHRTRDRVVVGQRERVVAALERRGRPAPRAATRHRGTRRRSGSGARHTTRTHVRMTADGRRSCDAVVPREPPAVEPARGRGEQARRRVGAAPEPPRSGPAGSCSPCASRVVGPWPGSAPPRCPARPGAGAAPARPGGRAECERIASSSSRAAARFSGSVRSRWTSTWSARPLAAPVASSPATGCTTSGRSRRAGDVPVAVTRRSSGRPSASSSTA